MRPTRLELKGFSSFRQATVVDFTGADLFALSGPTGAGKSSLIDAMTFALFGSVARYGAKLVEPVISQGDVEARVLLDFSVDSVPYRVARVVRRTAQGGATTKEARLERLPLGAGGDSFDLALGAKEVTAAVESLLGLTFEHFCRTVVLPQGAFQDFLHATGKERQDLLIELLDVGIYQDVRKRARQRADEAKAQVAALTEQLESVAGVSDEAIATVEARLLVLENLSAEVAAAQPDLEAIRERGAALRAEHTRANEDLARLDGIEPPAGLADLAQRLQQADQALEAARAGAEAAASAREQAQDAAADLPTARELTTVLEALAEVPTLARAVETAATRHETLQAEAVAAHKVAEESAADAASAQDSVRAAEIAQGVHALRSHLVAGEPCPLCAQHVGVVPDGAAPEDLVAARGNLQAAEARVRTALEAASKAEVAAARAGEQVAAAQQRLATHRDGLARLRAAARVADEDDEQVAVRQREAAEREQALEGLHLAERQARAAVATAEAQVASLAGQRSGAMVAVREAHARVADLGAPAPGDDIAASWAALADWVDEERPRRSAAVAEAAARVAEAIEAWSARQQLVLDAVAAAGVAIPTAMDAATAVATARAEAAAQASTLRERQAQAVELAKRVDQLRERANVAASLGQILQANRFQQWLIARALTRLVVGASGILGDLSHGAYSLTLGTDNAFLVADHRNAGEERNARSLSGGETFLASLALALSLAEHVADLAAKGSARLESLFLDEGFGTLDADTLDVVATCIEELGATGRMVGLITHVPDLAQRVPVRFEVARTPEGSQVTRVDT